ncbi:Oidioi.mRNA.OKI2018_I69.chr1.g2528.t1.cds [Oikopleura dioica]|uniref:Oidioi.mRNA.OKI2018_I69.chr1.g2528.t1.cds n=1 Tax=Oikopleura dioica TaxID=34765 RepID=A0ABN7SVP6_OIKDI|nr:Oidioi.mRNA.OKI2018_I69.chr1.g2528.t1.cds [Oikopleura dioica]
MKLSFVTVFAAAAARELDADNAEARLELIKGHFETLKSLTPADGSNFAARFDSRMTKLFDLASSSFTGVNCKSTNILEETAELEDSRVFTEDNACKLNGQVNSALSSWARNFACQGRGKTYRQIIRRARKVQAFYASRLGC